MKIFLLILPFLISVVQANLPLYEVGIAGGGGYLSDYPASNQGRIRTIFLPTVLYRGEIFKNDRKGTRALFFESEYTSIDLSIGASFPANSKYNEARNGMDDLDWLGELGPRLNVDLYKKNSWLVEVEFPVRFVFSTDFEFTKKRGYRFYPQLDIRKKLNKNYQINFSLKMNWATESLNDYFYEVDGSDINPNRERYNAKAGYVGSYLSTFLTYKTDKFYIIGGAQYGNYENSSNQNSPLYKSKEDTAVYMALNYFFYQSKELAPK